MCVSSRLRLQMARNGYERVAVTNDAGQIITIITQVQCLLIRNKHQSHLHRRLRQLSRLELCAFSQLLVVSSLAPKFQSLFSTFPLQSMLIDFVHEHRALVGDAVAHRQVSAFKGMHQGMPCTIKTTDKVWRLGLLVSFVVAQAQPMSQLLTRDLCAFSTPPSHLVTSSVSIARRVSPISFLSHCHCRSFSLSLRPSRSSLASKR